MSWLGELVVDLIVELITLPFERKRRRRRNYPEAAPQPLTRRQRRRAKR